MIITYANWPWIFFVNVPVGVIALMATFSGFPTFARAAVGFVTIPEIIGVGVVLLMAFLAFESRQEEPLIPMQLFRNRNFSLMSWTGAAMAFGMQGIFIPLSI